MNRFLAPLSIFFVHNLRMALVVFLRGVNVGGHRTFRPSLLAKKLSDYDVVNIGAAGTFVVRKAVSQSKFRAALLRALPFEAEIVLCDGRDLLRLEKENPFVAETSVQQNRPTPDKHSAPGEPSAKQKDKEKEIVRFVSILSKAGSVLAPLPVSFPSDGDWLVRVLASRGQFVFGTYRRHMKTIGYLGRIDKLYGCPATTRNWNTITAIIRILKNPNRS
jgi:uncharacterized protein (DUF1697 family)